MSENKIPYKIYLTEEEMPTYWYNMRADMKVEPAPLLNPGTGEPLKAGEHWPVFRGALMGIKQAAKTGRFTK